MSREEAAVERSVRCRYSRTDRIDSARSSWWRNRNGASRRMSLSCRLPVTVSLFRCRCSRAGAFNRNVGQSLRSMPGSLEIHVIRDDKQQSLRTMHQMSWKSSGPDRMINLALASSRTVATSSGNHPGSQKHKLEHINDGQYGNSRSWISSERRSRLGAVGIPSRPETIDRIEWARDQDGQFQDRLAVDIASSVTRRKRLD